MRTLLESDPLLNIQVIPGITSFQEAAAKTRTILCEGKENLLLISGINDGRRLQQGLASADSAVILKAYKNFSEIFKVVQEANKDKNAILASRVGLDGERILRVSESSVQNTPYLSLLLVPPGRKKKINIARTLFESNV